MAISTGGGHRPGTGISGKTKFPANWSDEKILHEISDVATDPASKVTQQGKTTAAVVVIAVLVQSATPQDITALKARAETGDTRAQVRLGGHSK